MKKIIIPLYTIFLLFAVSLSVNDLSGNENIPAISGDPDEFLVGAYSVGCSPNNIMNQLGFNIWHRFIWQESASYQNYNQKVFPAGYLAADKLFSPLNGYGSETAEYYKSASSLNNNYLYLTRPKIEMLSFAQRSDYTPCDIPINGSTTKGYWWYGYDIHQTGRDTEENGRWYRKCEAGLDKAGYIVKDLRPVLEQSNESVPNGFFNDANYSWYVKPKVKIDPNVPDTTSVLRVEIYKKDGSLFRNVLITRKNFDNEGIYKSGEYRDMFFPDNDANPLFIKNGADLYGNSADANRPKNDYAIWWYGRCSMQIEHVRVENNIAKDLFGGKFETADNDWIRWEVQDIASAEGVKSYKFLIDEADHSMYPAIKYLNERIYSFRPQGSKLSLTAISNIVFNTPFLRERPGKPWMWNEPLPAEVVKNIFRESGMNEVFIDLYPVYADRFWHKDVGRRNYIPNSLPNTAYNVNEGRLGEPAPPEEYEENFNLNLEDEYHRYFRFMKYSNEISSEFNVPIIAAVQIHSWFNGSEAGYSLREPTNEEIEMLTGIALTYGAKGILFHAYNSIGVLGMNMFSRGLVGNLFEPVTEANQCDDTHRRLVNAYGQQKWNKIISLTAKLKTLGKEIINFDNTKTRSYRLNVITERTGLFADSYIGNITAFRNGTETPQCKVSNIPQGMTYDCPDKTFLQVGTFRNKNGEPYFMIVNRRASPVKEGSYDGRRFIRISVKAGSSGFEGYGSLKIIDTETNTTIAVIDKRETTAKDIGWIMPGEIKLYKIIPGS